MTRLHYPLRVVLAKTRVNKTLHGRSVYRRTDVPGHNVFMGYSKPGTGDGVDLFAPAGTEVFAMHDGRVTSIQHVHGRNDQVMLVGTVDGKPVTTLYAHIHPQEGLKRGDTVKADQRIGFVGRILNDPHLHLEIRIAGVSVAASTPRAYANELVELCG